LTLALPFRSASRYNTRMNPLRLLTPALCCAALLVTSCKKSESSAGGTGKPGKKLKIAYVTNGVDPFWNTAAAGVRAAEEEVAIDCEVLMAPTGPELGKTAL